ncbi:hypothetical protein [Arthrobacter sp. V1I9]|nr:hypothetical protein [Arthrobacter sp. V1I9]
MTSWAVKWFVNLTEVGMAGTGTLEVLPQKKAGQRVNVRRWPA